MNGDGIHENPKNDLLLEYMRAGGVLKRRVKKFGGCEVCYSLHMPGLKPVKVQDGAVFSLLKRKAIQVTKEYNAVECDFGVVSL